MDLEKKENTSFPEFDVPDNGNSHRIANWFLTLVLSGAIILFIFGIRHNMKQSEDFDKLFRSFDEMVEFHDNLARMDGYIIREQQIRSTTFKMKDSAKTDAEYEEISRQFIEHYKVFDSTTDSFKISHTIPSAID